VALDEEKRAALYVRVSSGEQRVIRWNVEHRDCTRSTATSAPGQPLADLGSMN